MSEHLVIAAFWADGDPADLTRVTAEAIHGLKFHPDSAGSVVTFPKATAEGRTFKAVLMKLDLAEVAPSHIASYVGGPRDATGGEVESLDPIPLDGGEYRFLEIGTDLDAVFKWHSSQQNQKGGGGRG